MTGAQIVTEALGLAGNSSLDADLALAKLNRILDKLYRKKFSWQRLTANVSFTAGSAVNTAQWPGASFLDIYEHDDGSVWRYTDPSNNVLSGRALNYRQYINLAGRLTATGSAPQFVAFDAVVGRWYVYPLLDASRVVDVDYYQKPADILATQTPLWSQHASDDILVDALKQWALEWQDDARQDTARALVTADIGAYRRKDQAKEGIVHQSALDPRVFRRGGRED